MTRKPIEPLLTKVSECVSERLDQMEILNNPRSYPDISKDEDLRSKTRRSLRLIKQN